LNSALSGTQDAGFNATIFQCIDRALTSILGKDAAYSLHYAVATNLHLSQTELERSPEKLVDGLNMILGQNGFLTLEPAMINEICYHFRISGGERKNLRAVIEEARKTYLL